MKTEPPMTERPVVLLTGGTGVVGQSLLAALAVSGYDVVYTTRSEAKKATYDRAATPAQGAVTGVVVNLEDADAAQTLTHLLHGWMGRLVGIVHNVRNLDHLKLGPSGEVAEGSWFGEFKLGVVLPHALTLSLVGAGAPLSSVVVISSMYGVVAPQPGLYTDFVRQSPVHYGPVKAAAIQLTKELAVRLAPQGVRVNSVSYGGVAGRAPADFVERYAQRTPINRMLDEADIPGPVLFLLSAAASGVNGHNLICDGGWSIW